MRNRSLGTARELKVDPDSNLFGERDPKTYGTTTLAQIEEQVTKLGKELGINVRVLALLTHWLSSKR